MSSHQLDAEAVDLAMLWLALYVCGDRKRMQFVEAWMDDNRRAKNRDAKKQRKAAKAVQT